MKLHPSGLLGVAAVATSRGIAVVDAFNAFGQLAPLLQAKLSAFTPPPPPPSRVDTESWLDVLRYDEPPKFDVLARTVEYANCKDFDDIMTYYADDYVFRGPVVGPITAEDVRKTSEVSVGWMEQLFSLLSSDVATVFFPSISPVPRVSPLLTAMTPPHRPPPSPSPPPGRPTMPPAYIPPPSPGLQDTIGISQFANSTVRLHHRSRQSVSMLLLRTVGGYQYRGGEDRSVRLAPDECQYQVTDARYERALVSYSFENSVASPPTTHATRGGGVMTIFIVS
jgi:hypothetical protein